MDWAAEELAVYCNKAFQEGFCCISSPVSDPCGFCKLFSLQAINQQ